VILNLVLAKIGGSSLKGPEDFKHCLKVLENTPSIRAIVISATFNTTNLLEELASKSISRDFTGAVEVLKELKDVHQHLVSSLEIDYPVEGLILKAQTIALDFLQKEKKCSRTMDALYSIGELLSANIFAAYLKKVYPKKKIHFLDAREVIVTGSQFGSARPLFGEIRDRVEKKLRPLLCVDSLVIIPGFIGQDQQGRTTTLGREGSDLSAALLASALNVDELHIYKDVAGIYTADPKLVENAKAQKRLNFACANTLSEYGAKVLFPQALKPVMDKNIKVFIGSTKNPGIGTEIVRGEISDNFSGITLRSSFCRIDLEPQNPSQNFKENVLEILAEKKITPEQIIYSEKSLSLILAANMNLPQELRDHLREFCKVSQENRVSLTTLVGTGLKKGEKLILEAVEKLLEENISLTRVDEGPNYLTYAFPSRFEHKVLNDLHHILFS